MQSRKRVLTMGLHPDYVDFSKVPVPGLNATTLMQGLKAEEAKLTALGYDAQTLLIDDGETAESVVAAALAPGGFDCVLIGAGLRRLPEHFLLFEKLVNLVHRSVPATTRICFNTEPTDTVEAIRRWV
jgi:hypothetical protein